MDEKDLIPFNRKESSFFVDLILLRNTMFKNLDAMKDRLKAFPGDWEDLQDFVEKAERIQNNLSNTIPPEKLLRYKQLVERGRYYMDLQGPIPKKDYRLIDSKELSDVAEAAIKGECALCMAEGREVKRCKLRNALLTIAPPTEVSKYKCEYRSVAGDLIAGREVVL